MSIIAVPVQDALPFDVGSDVLVASAPVYDGRARKADRELCQRYFASCCFIAGAIAEDKAICWTHERGTTRTCPVRAKVVCQMK
ncbi:hypothetical protein PV761_10080 [Arthrobacter sp. CC3]|uniref:hypothetical protein n=1 Tax=Arthrobacter sp. CC3 TaxID=3029185 RepID=UPI0032663D43